MALLVVVVAAACGNDGSDNGASGSSSSTTSPPAAPDERLTALDPCGLLTGDELLQLAFNFDPPDAPVIPPDPRPTDPPVEHPRDDDRACEVSVHLDHVVGSMTITLYPTTPSSEVSSVRRDDQEALDDDEAVSEEIELGGRQAELVGYDGGQITGHAGICAVRIPTSETSTVEVYGHSIADGLLACRDIRDVAEMVVDAVPALQG